MHAAAPRTRGFTLVEILIVVVILGILAAIVIPSFSSSTRETRQGAFVSSIKTFNKAAALFRQREFEWPEDASSGVLPTGFDQYVDEDDWTAVTPIGGVWDTERNSYGIVSALGVHFNGTGDTQDDAFMTEIDSQFDDGNLNTGAFRKLDANRYYVVMAD